MNDAHSGVPPASIKIIPLLFISALVSTSMLAQTDTPSVPPSDVPLRPVINTDPVQPDVTQYEAPLSWKDKRKDKLVVPFANKADKNIKVLGVQSTYGIFIVDYPNSVKAGKEDGIEFIYDATENSDGDTEFIRVLTDDGIKTITIKLKREQAVSFSTKELSWKVGEKAEAKTVKIATNSGVSVKKVKSPGGGHKAELVREDASTWIVKVTPSSTTKKTTFAVVVEFDQAVLGVSPVISGVVED